MPEITTNCEKAISRKGDGFYELRLKVTPKASSSKIGGLVADSEGNMHLKVYVTTVPEKGKANKAVIELLAKELKVPKSSISIVAGETDSYKTVRVTHRP